MRLKKIGARGGVGETKPNLLVCNFEIGLISICFHGNECLLFKNFNAYTLIKFFRLRRAKVYASNIKVM